MKRILGAVLAMCLALPLAAADDRELKEQLVAEILEMLDVRKMIESTFGNYGGDSAEEKAMRDRVLARLDYAKLGQEAYAPLFREHFNTEELKQLVAFYRTKAGQKSIDLLPSLSTGILEHAAAYISEVGHEVDREMKEERRKDRPDLATMSDLRTIATCVEARATDTNDYPNVTFDQLPPLLEPTYVRRLPREDAWGTPYFFIADGRNYRIVSAGADKKFEYDSRRLDLREAEPRPMDSLDADIIFQNGSFLQFPRKAAPAPDPAPH